MPRAKKVAEEVKEEAKKVSTRAKKAVADVKAETSKAKTTAKKVAADVKAETSTRAKKAVETAAAKVEKDVKKVAVKKPAAKKALNLVIQSKMGGSITAEEVAAKIPKNAINAYVKVEENKIYWTTADDAGSVDIWE